MPLPEHLIVSTDFDGTLTSPDHPDILAPDFMDWLEEARRRIKVTWVINTGRCWPTLSAELERRRARFLPDWVALIEREIHRVRNGVPSPLASWNDACSRDHEILFKDTKALWKTMRQKLESFAGLQMIRDIGCPLGLIAEDEEQGDAIEEIATVLIAEDERIIMVRNSIYFRFGHRSYSKGSCLREIARSEGLGPDSCFAAGDHFNDLSMLERGTAAYLCCPGNSAPLVRKQVESQKGYLAELPYNQGVVEGLNHYFSK